MDSHRDNGDDFVSVIPPSEGPVIVPLLDDRRTPRNKAIFEILAADFISESRAKLYLWRLRFCRFWSIPEVEAEDGIELGDNSRSKQQVDTQTPPRSENYRRARQEFLCFMCCYGSLGIYTLFLLAGVLVTLVINSSKWNRSELHNYQYAPHGEKMTDDDYSAYKAKNFREMVSYFLYGDGGFD
jgi:hypothetical protein